VVVVVVVVKQCKFDDRQWRFNEIVVATREEGGVKLTVTREEKTKEGGCR